MEQKGNVTYPRPQMELVCVLDEAEQAGHLPETIVEEFTEHPFSMPALWACRDHFYRLDAAARRSHPALPSVFALLAAMAGDLDLAREYVSLLGTTPRHWRMQDLREKDYYRICTELVMPYISDGMFLRIVLFLVKTGMVPVRSLTLSACRPSIINGFRDFTRFGPYLERHKDAITQMIHQLYGSVGKNVYEIMLAEWYYQNNDCFNALILATGTIPLIERESDMRCLFVALALQMRILLMNGQARTAKPLGEKIRDRIQETGREELTASLNALECLAACYDGQQEAVAQWLENTAPDENRDIYMMDMFAWLTKVRCYLQVGKNMAAYVLVRQLITLLEPGKRHMALCLTLLPASTLAAEAQGQAGQEQTVLTQGNDGQTQAPGQDGAGEDDKTSDEAPDKAPDKAPDEEPDEAVSAVQALIDALPAAEDISDANADEVSGQLDAIDEAKQALTEEQAARLDLTGYDAAAAAVLALAGEPDANESALLAAIAGTQPGGSGTAEDPYRITGAAELIWLRDAVNAGEANTCAKLQQDVEYVDEVWTPIGTSEHPYTGTFNGNGHTIRVWLDDWGQALFGYVGANAKLTDIAVTKRQSKNYSISASAPLARINNGTITRCRYSGGITAKDSLGGLVYTNSGTIEACCVYAGRLDGGSRIEMYYSGWAGGIAYENTGTIVNSYFYGDIVQAQSNGTVRDIIGWGAIAYKNSGTVSNCYYGADRDDGYGGKTEDQFRGGEVTYLLNGGTARDDWRQNCYAGDNSDATPVLDRSHAQVRKTGSSYVSLYPHVHCICGGDATSGGHPRHSDVPYTAWTNDEAASQYGDSSHTAANSLPKDPGKYYLTSDVTLRDTGTWRPADGTVLCLNGQTVREFAFDTPAYDAITVGSGVTFSLTECASIQGYIYCASSRRAVHTVNNSGTFNFYNGRLRDTKSKADGAAVYNTGTFNMYGGTINDNNTTARGGGVYNAGACNLYGGTITNNGTGGGVYNNGTLTVGGTATVTGGSPNVYLAAGKTITLNSALDESARIGITAEKQSSLTDTAAITVVEGGAASLVCFFPDDDGTYDLSFNDDDDVLLHLIRDHTHCACGHKGKYAKSIGNHTEHVDREFVAWTDELVKEQYGSGTTYKAADTLPKAAGYYYLTSDVDLGAYPWAPKDGTILCLNGHKITGSWSTAVRIDSNAHIVLTDCRASGSIRNTNTSGAALKSSGSSISRNGIADIFRISLSGTSVGVENYTSNTVNLYNSTVSGTTSAIYNTGTVNIAGTVKATSDTVGSGYYCVNNLGTLTVDGTLTADGGNIGVANRKESSSSRSGTITVDGTLTSTGDNTGLSNLGTLTVNGALTATGKGTATLASGLFNNGGTLTVAGTLTAAGNTSGRSTYGLYNTGEGTVTANGTFTASGGEYAVYNFGPLNLAGTVNANKNVYLGTGRTITVVGELDDASSITVQTKDTPAAGSPVVIATTENADWIKAGSFVSWTPGKYAVSRIDEGKTVVLRGHEHDWSYTLGSDGTAISAECGNADGLCGNTNGGSVTIAPPSGGLIYDGSAKAARLTTTGWTAADVGEITYQKDGSALSAAPVDAGTYTAGITVGGQTASVTYTIRQAVPQAGDFAFSPPDTLTYDGSAKTAKVAARAGIAGMGGVTVKYYRNGVEVEQPADVGTYNVRIDVAEGKNYAAADLTDDSWTFTIAANETAPAVTLSGDTTYTGGRITPAPTVKIGSTKLTEGRDYTVAYGENRDVSTGGTVTITAMGNYAFSAVAESFAITPRAVTVSGITAADKTYNGSADAVLDVSGAVISGKAEGDELTVSADGTFDSKDVGTDKTVRISGLTLGGTSAGNYRLAASGQQASAMAAITPAVITVTPDAGQGKTYGEKDPTLTYISAGAVNGETPAFRGVLVRDTGANAGSYAITGGTLALADGSGFKADNYTLKLADEVVYFTIHRAAYGDRTVNGSAMYDNNGTVDLSSLIEEGGTAVLGSVTDDAGVLNGTCSISEGILRFGFADDASKVGKTAKVKVNVTGADNYEDYTITVTLTVEAKLTPSPEGALTLSPAEITYGEKLGAIAISGTMQADGRTVAGTFTWQEPDTVLDAGTHAGAAWKFMPDDTKTYVEATGTVAVQVNRAAQSAAVSMTGFTYNDAPSAPSLTYQVGDGRAVYYYGTENTASGGTKWENMQPTTLDAGTYYMYAVIGETDNYREFTTAAVQFVVEKATPTYKKPTGVTAKYGQTLGDIALATPEGTTPGTWSWQTPQTVLDKIGSHTYDANFKPDDPNYKGVVGAAIDVTVGPADGRNLRTVELVQKYTDTEKHTYAPDWSSLPEGQRWTFSSEASEVLPRQDFAADGSLLTYAIPEGKALGDQITITLKASCANYEDFTITLHILLREKDDQAALRVTGGTTVVYGEKLQLGSSGGSGTGKVAYAVTNGTGEAVIDPDTGVLTPVKVGIVTVSVTKAEDKDYKEAVSDAVIVTITKARPTGQPNYTKIITRGKTLDDAALTLADSTISPADGVLEWVDDAGNVLPGSTRVKANTAYKWRFTPADGNYTTLSGEIELYYKPNGGSQYGTDHTIRASAGTNGTISPVGWTSVGEGGEQTFTITPDAGYAVAKVLVDGRSVGAVTSYTFRNVTQDHTIEAVFMKANGNPQTGVTVTRSTIGCGR